MIARSTTNLQVEPSYPGLQTIRYPDWTIHQQTELCIKDWPHPIIECREWNFENN